MATISGGHKLAEKLREIAAGLSNGATLRVGFLERASYPSGKINVATVAAINEFGAASRGIPARPFFRNMVAAKSKEWPAAIAGLLVTTHYDATQTMELAGQAIAGQLRQSIVDTNSPPNASSTIAKKGAAKPLVDTGHLLQSVDYEVNS
jgi:hypothetical protein